MPTQTAAQPDPQTAGTDAPKKRRIDFKSKKVRIIGLLVVVMLVEAAGFYFLVLGPSSSKGADEEDEAERNVPTVEVKIGEQFTLTNFASPGTQQQVSFALYAEVAQDQSVAFDLLANKDRTARVREAVGLVIRRANLDDLNDPGQSVIKKQLREEINKVLEKSYVRQAILVGFQIQLL